MGSGDMLQLKVGTHGLITVAALTGEFDAAPQDDVAGVVALGLEDGRDALLGD